MGFPADYIIDRDYELIDTQWDVNKEDNVLLMLTAFELIDTQWDVN